MFNSVCVYVCAMRSGAAKRVSCVKVVLSVVCVYVYSDTLVLQEEGERVRNTHTLYECEGSSNSIASTVTISNNNNKKKKKL